MLKPFSNDTLMATMDMIVLSAVIDQNITSEHLEGPLKTHLASTVVSLARHNVIVTELAAAEHLQIPDMSEVRTVVKKGTTFGVITGGKGL
jgi:hypothetical protein